MNIPHLTDLKSSLQGLFSTALAAIASDAAAPPVELERPKQAEHGDFSCNLALQLAKRLRRSPREVAQALIAALPASPLVEKVEIAGAGFINLFLRPAAKQQVVSAVLASGADYGKTRLGQGKKILLEFVSSNPTGPLHVAHGRAAAFGASLANVLDAAGYVVQREFYVNDAGRQMDILALSTWLRYLEACGIAVAFPPNCYQGGYVKSMAEQIRASYGDRYVQRPGSLLEGAPDAQNDPEGHLDALIANAKKLLGDGYAYIHNHALTEQLGDMRHDLMGFGVHYDTWFSEQSLYDNGLLERAMQRLDESGHTYHQDGAKWFRSSHFGDDKDRVLTRENGLHTYFAPDIAYHLNKFERGHDTVIDVWGPDHHGYIPRVRAAIQALGVQPERFEVIISQLVKLYRDGKLVKLSTRAGEYVTLRELRQEVGDDAARFFYVLRRSDQQLDFDLDLAKSHSTDNPVYYVQYAHARVCSVFEKWGGSVQDLHAAEMSRLIGAREFALMQRLMDYPEAIENAARDYSPHLIAYYLKDLAAELHGYYNAERILVEDEALQLARLALMAAVRQVLKNGLSLLGVNAPEKM